MIVRSRQNALHYVWGGTCDGWRLLDGPDLTVIEERMPPGTAETRHFHTVARQLFYVKEGRLFVEAGSEKHVIEPGESVEVAPGVVHLVSNPHSTDAVFLVVSAPATTGDRIELP